MLAEQPAADMTSPAPGRLAAQSFLSAPTPGAWPACRRCQDACQATAVARATPPTARRCWGCHRPPHRRHHCLRGLHREGSAVALPCARLQVQQRSLRLPRLPPVPAALGAQQTVASQARSEMLWPRQAPSSAPLTPEAAAASAESCVQCCLVCDGHLLAAGQLLTRQDQLHDTDKPIQVTCQIYLLGLAMTQLSGVNMWQGLQ